jgi:hypothetical protein
VLCLVAVEECRRRWIQRRKGEKQQRLQRKQQLSKEVMVKVEVIH